MKLDVREKIEGFLRTKTRQQIAFGLVAIFLGFDIAYGYLFIEPAASGFFARIKESQNMATDIAQVSDSLKRQDLLKSRLGDMNKKVAFYEKQLPQENEVPALLEELSRMAKDSNVKILAINPNEKGAPASGDKTKKPYKALPIGITALCGYHELGAFINKLENADRFMSIKDLDIKTNPGNKKLHTVNIVVYTYILVFKGA